MGALSQRLKPKHQVLILKCYPRMQKSIVEIRPNSSELSYLLYYVSTRRSKLQKVGAYLEKKTDSDVYNLRLGNVQVTLQIITAVIDKCPRDVPLYVSNVLHILDTILNTHDINLIEASLPAFTALCTHYDSATLSAEQDLTRRYDAIIRTYASFASRTTPVKNNGKTTSIPEAIRFRSLGLQAIKSIVSSDFFNADSGKHLRVFMPFILENLHSENPTYLGLLRHREASDEQHEKEQVQAQRHRPSLSISRSTAVVATTESLGVDPAIAAGTAADVDRRADEQVGVLALQSLRQIFTPNNRNQVRVATSAMLGFAMSRLLPSRQKTDTKLHSKNRQTWPTEIFDMVCRWTPVQDRYIILVTAMESLVRSPIVEDDLPNQLELANLIGSLLRSNINFIGLSVMDVLTGLIQHILLLLQLGGQGSNLTPHHQQALSVLSETFGAPRAAAPTSPVTMEVVPNASAPRIELLAQLQHCVGDLATHVYYSDQIADMVAAILLRLKPSPTSAIPTAAAAVEDPAGAAEAIAESVSLQEKPHTDGFFSFDTARLLALKAVTEILVVANSGRKDHTGAVGRNRVDIPTWEGTQWLLRDPDGRVRKAYVEALLTWLRLEIDKTHLDLVDDHFNPRSKAKDADSNGSQFARRAISNASTRSRRHSRTRSFFLQLLHLAVYENALQSASSEPDTLLLHLLLVTLVQKLGVNAVRTGLPMIFRLQEEMNAIPSSKGRIAVGSLIHGYFWALCETFDFDNSILGRDIHGEISRRSTHGLWLRSIRMPPVQLEHIGNPLDVDIRPATGTLQGEQHIPMLHPFDARHAVVDMITEGYERPIHSPPSSPLPSPSRTMSYTAIMSSASSVISHHGRHLPAYVHEELLSVWTRENCLASFTTHESAIKAASFAPSRGSPRTYLSPYGNSSAVNMNTMNTPSVHNGDDPTAARTNSIGHSSTHSIVHGGLPHSAGTKFFGPPIGEAQQLPHRRSSRQSSRTPRSVSSASYSIARVSDMKRALEGTQGSAALPLTGFSTPQIYGIGVVHEGPDSARQDAEGGIGGEDTNSDSMVSLSPSFDEGSVISGHNYSAAPANAGIGIASSSALPVPSSLLAPPGAGTEGVDSSIARNSSVRSRRTLGGSGAVGGRGSALGQHVASPRDVMDLLRDIDEDDSKRQTVVSVLGAPPY